MNFQTTSFAEAELAEALVYYRDIDHALGTRFLREYEETLQRLVQFPLTGSCRCNGQYRLAFIRGFPYGIAYSVEDGRVIVESVPHLHRSPSYWRDSL